MQHLGCGWVEQWFKIKKPNCLGKVVPLIQRLMFSLCVLLTGKLQVELGKWPPLRTISCLPCSMWLSVYVRLISQPGMTARLELRWPCGWQEKGERRRGGCKIWRVNREAAGTCCSNSVFPWLLQTGEGLKARLVSEARFPPTVHVTSQHPSHLLWLINYASFWFVP